MKGFNNIPIRFFIWDSEQNENEGGYTECHEREFLNAEGVIEYEHFAVLENGVSQICLTKNPFI